MGRFQPGSVKRDELGFTALCRRALCRGLLGHWGLLLRRAAGGRHLRGRHTGRCSVLPLQVPASPSSTSSAPEHSTNQPVPVFRPLKPTLLTPPSLHRESGLPVPSRDRLPLPRHSGFMSLELSRWDLGLLSKHMALTPNRLLHVCPGAP